MIIGNNCNILDNSTKFEAYVDGIIAPIAPKLFYFPQPSKYWLMVKRNFHQKKT